MIIIQRCVGSDCIPAYTIPKMCISFKYLEVIQFIKSDLVILFKESSIWL